MKPTTKCADCQKPKCVDCGNCPDCGKHASDCAKTKDAAKFSDQIDQLVVVEDRGRRGGVIAIPVARTARLNPKRTAGGGETESMSIDRTMFDQVVENFSKRAGPLAVYFGHENEIKRAPDTPAIGFVRRVWVEGDTLWNEIDLGPKAWDLIVTQRGFAGASIEMQMDADRAMGLLPGWSQSGLSITNNPALDIQFIAASETAPETLRVSRSFSAERPEGGSVMSATVTLEGLQAEKLTLEEKVRTLEAEGTATKAKVAALELANAELSKRPTVDAMLEVQGKVHAIEQEHLADKVRAVKVAALAAGKPPVLFAANGDFVACDDDPIKFLQQRFGGNLAALKINVDSTPAVAVKMANANAGPGSGAGTGAANGQPREMLFAEVQKRVANRTAKNFAEGLDQVKAEMPELYGAVAAGYGPPPSEVN